MKKKVEVLRLTLKTTNSLQPSFLPLQFLFACTQLVLVFISIYLPSFVINQLTQATHAKEAIPRIITILTIALVVRLLSVYLKAKVTLLNHVLINQICGYMSEQMTNVSFETLEDPTFIDKCANAIEPIQNLNVVDMLFIAIPNIIQYTITLIGVIFILLIYNVWLVIFIVSLSSLQFLFNRQGVKKETEYAKSSFKENKAYWYYLRTMNDITSAKDIRVYKLQPFLLQKVSEVYNHFIYSGSRGYGIRDIRELIGKVCSTLVMAFMYIFLVYSTIKNPIDASYLILLVNAATSMFMTLNLMQTELLNVNQALIYLEGFVEFEKAVTSDHLSGTKVLDEPIHCVEFKDVCFSYPKSDVLVLNHLNLTITDKLTISLVGRNGSGKTTIVKLLSRLYQPTSGEILVNGVNINEYEYTSYLNQLSIIFQDFKNFQESIEENITFNNVNREKLEEAIKQADLKKEVNTFPNGIHTHVGKEFSNDGIHLSKGQEQKLAIARSIYKGGSLMILDEPAASLDPLAEEEVYKHFQHITNNKLSILISHRLSSCSQSDCIILLEDGQVKEKGNHEQLMKQAGLYADMYTLQSSAYES
ncbi:ABC transporter ATP-binding protein [Breznakia pachnodae]|uniref:ABC-type multidrug transport system fused ATPase/permease subunit n=1 Tax=Breznakia pachnodae TaxID=265178 RepID=A0ABU0E3Q8_9FIRM|nr:ABC transporter ATP-binding protein [Breznakia pachnodae]MDQ0361522.1 ABC-type multidrug transport system fused ATPase/permease subunit [Breznakia pachnodae]